ncbi:hypothetical protein CLV91_3001 [Maribacter vaceletii]|uniref:Lipoprotein n=1 Tax=Maribacter vaceletii TaxID=1206816 RepID=A0A495DW45_9FLAO|nr:hypothetical protein [Maribacter vaceletii]RKR07817.1 hypothetical protein CLV91_3001 [Maribacter vaceletii]
MKYQILFITITALFISCSNDKKATETAKQFSSLKSDILLENSMNKPFNTNNNEEHTLFISGKNILEGTATLKVTNKKGEELSCTSFPAKKLIHQEYKMANSTLQEQHLREVVKTFFTEDINDSIANL